MHVCGSKMPKRSCLPNPSTTLYPSIKCGWRSLNLHSPCPAISATRSVVRFGVFYRKLSGNSHAHRVNWQDRLWQSQQIQASQPQCLGLCSTGMRHGALHKSTRVLFSIGDTSEISTKRAQGFPLLSRSVGSRAIAGLLCQLTHPPTQGRPHHTPPPSLPSPSPHLPVPKGRNLLPPFCTPRQAS